MKKRSLAFLSIPLIILAACQEQSPLLSDVQLNDNQVSANAILKSVNVQEIKNTNALISDTSEAIVVATMTGSDIDSNLKQKLYFNFEDTNSSDTGKEIIFGNNNITKVSDKRHHKNINDFNKEKSQAKKAFKLGRSFKNRPTNAIPREGSLRAFNVLLDDNGKYEKRNAVLYKVSKTANFWLDKKISSDIDEKALAKSIKYWEEKAFPIVTTKFGQAPMPPNDVDGEARINLFLTPLDTGLYGYFYSADVLADETTPETNKTDMLYINSDIFKPGEADENSANGTLIHEFQHMVNFNVKVTQRLNQKKDPIYEDRWVDEGMSTYSEQLGGYGLPANDEFSAQYLQTFFKDTSVVPIVTNSGEINYGTSLLFVLYLVEQYGPDVVKKLTSSDKSGIENIEYVTGKPFKTVFNEWATAMLLSGSKKDAKFDFKSVNLHKNYGKIKLDGVSLNNLVNEFPKKAGFNMYNWTVNYIKLSDISKNKVNMSIKHNGKGTLTTSLVKIK